MIKIKFISSIILVIFFTNPLFGKEPSKLIAEIVNEASIILSSSDPVESKIIKLNNIAETNVDINGIGLYTLGKYRKDLNEDQKIKYKSYSRALFEELSSDYDSDQKIMLFQKKLMISI